MSATLSAEDLRLLQYFWQEKRDLSCWSGFEDALPRIETGYPELARAWRAVVTTPRIVTAMLYYLMARPVERTVSRALTEDELSELWWAWTDREDLTCVSWFTSRIPALELDYPELVKAWHDYQSAHAAMNQVMEQVGRLAEDITD
ncbi:hypothetical protein [Burkholderia ubonensis]|uniref:hypothetical protein n=1 Tax=Burkholderia ubonensis TaxID=101571 RepID=UPI00075E20D5|nr:hypothetical protein [Burkholderia ubonensis]KVP16836.1 hypothetical protein WJ84_00760 [Burkholderia ubonensis]